MEQARQDNQKKKEEADRAKAEGDKKIQEEKDKKKAELEKTQKDRALFAATKRAELEDKTLANRVATEAFGGQPDSPVNPNSRRVSPKSDTQENFEIGRRLLFEAAQQRRREMNQ